MTLHLSHEQKTRVGDAFAWAYSWFVTALAIAAAICLSSALLFAVFYLIGANQ